MKGSVVKTYKRKTKNGKICSVKAHGRKVCYKGSSLRVNKKDKEAFVKMYAK